MAISTEAFVQGFVFVLALVFGANVIGARFTRPALEGWYRGLWKPSWTPSGAVIGAVWAVLYTLMALAAWLVWLDGGPAAWPALALFAAQLALNVAWSGLFFSLRNLRAAFAEIVVLWAAIFATILAFLTISTLAALLLVPYLAWVAFAAYLNYEIWRRNPAPVVGRSDLAAQGE